MKLKQIAPMKTYKIILLLIVVSCFSLMIWWISLSTEPTANKVNENLLGKEMVERIEQITFLYEDLYKAAEKTSSISSGQIEISQKVIDEIEELLISKGYPVVDTDDKYPSYLENSDVLQSFLDGEMKGTAEIEIISINKSGGLIHKLLSFRDGQSLSFMTEVKWNSNSEPEMECTEKKEILNWNTTFNGNFYYQDLESDMHYDAATLVRLNPVDKVLYDLNETYIMPIGYRSNNLFLCNWDSSNYGDLIFNDLLEYFYKINKHEFFVANKFESTQNNNNYWKIPASFFEETVMPYFNVSLQEFRQRGLYNELEEIYPWQEAMGESLIYFPTLISEVTSYEQNSDGTLTIFINVMCLDIGEDCLFTHKITIQPLENENYKYLGNDITYESDVEKPPYIPRLESQRSNNK